MTSILIPFCVIVFAITLGDLIRYVSVHIKVAKSLNERRKLLYIVARVMTLCTIVLGLILICNPIDALGYKLFVTVFSMTTAVVNAMQLVFSDKHQV